MAADLADLKRLKITAETRAWLQSEAHRTGRSQQDIARDALHKMALDEIHAAKLLLALAPGEGHAGDAQGHSRDNRGQGGRR